LSRDDETEGLGLTEVDPPGLEEAHERVPRVRRVAEAEGLRRLGRDAARFDRLARELGTLAPRERPQVEPGRLVHDGVARLTSLPLLTFAPRLGRIDARDLDASPLGEALARLGKGERLDLHVEPNRVA